MLISHAKISKIEIFLRIVVGGLFAWAGFQKLTRPYENFLFVVENYELLPEWGERAVAAVFPWVELLGGAFFALGLWGRAALFTLWGLTTAFIIAVGSALLRGLPIEECGCFGEQFPLSLKGVLGLEVFLFIFFAATAFRTGDTDLSIDRFYGRGKKAVRRRP